MNRLILIVCAFFFSVSAQANQQGTICYKYQRADYTWSKAYKLNAQLVTGQQMVEATNNYTKYSSIYNYVVIPWNDGGYSALKVNSWDNEFYMLPSYYKQTRDQNNRQVKFKRGSYCS